MEKYYFIFILFFSLSNSQIFNNPRNLDNNSYPFVFFSPSDDFDYIFTSGKCIKIERSTGNIIRINETINYSSDTIFIVDKSNISYLYLYNKNTYYKITYDPQISFQSFTVRNEPKSVKTYKVSIIGAISKNDGFIIYSKYEGY